MFADSTPFDPEKDSRWLRLIHLRRGEFGNWKSEITGKSFFLSRGQGLLHPKSEWEATLEKFNEEYSGPVDLNPKCLFPARFRLMNEILDGKFKNIPCPELQRWKNAVNAQSITLVYAAQFIRNPASLFGHVFLRFDKALTPSENGFRLDSFSRGVGYVALVPETTNSLEYIFKGLTGGFQGRFHFSTYAKSLIEYSYIEDRDLWEFSLQLTRNEIDQILNHLWELSRLGEFYYGFFLTNCAYQAIALLEGAVPRLNLIQNHSLFFTPTDAIKGLISSGMILNFRFRPSLGTQLRNSIKFFSDSQKRDLEKIMDSQIPPSDVKDSKVLNAAIDWFDYRNYQTKGKITDKFTKQRDEVLKARARLPSDQDNRYFFDKEKWDSPIEGHNSSQFTFNFFSTLNSKGFELGGRPAFHRINEGVGFPLGSTIEILDFRIAYREDLKKVIPDYLTFLQIENLREFEWIDQAFSWRIKFDYYNLFFQMKKITPWLLKSNLISALPLPPVMLNFNII